MAALLRTLTSHKFDMSSEKFNINIWINKDFDKKKFDILSYAIPLRV
jgi:hypothetical protein